MPSTTQPESEYISIFSRPGMSVVTAAMTGATVAMVAEGWLRARYHRSIPPRHRRVTMGAMKLNLYPTKIEPVTFVNKPRFTPIPYYLEQAHRKATSLQQMMELVKHSANAKR
eukprot:NODE_7527_length_431_cov_13.842105_g7361_i0.p1 GENE.NODE_7527_length_431_cov_13.842105_g7361_i0~~NODE_7527_length_431_cov_13.842105_g7361_i0.p1  ORF type:complete len:125 (+),score=35.50 NODE_7527_length_431_cov_13.842105_g7361_i0:37-375(+)